MPTERALGKKLGCCILRAIDRSNFLVFSTSVLSVKEQEGFADDYSFLIRGLLDLYEASQVTINNTPTVTMKYSIYEEL